MATPAQPSNPSPGNQGQGPTSRDLAQSIKQLIEDQGDYNNLLKNALKEANKMDGVYKRIQARIESMNKDTINTKRLNSELYALKQKEVIARKNVADLEKHLSSETKKNIEEEKNLRDKLNAGNLTALQKIKAQYDLKLTQSKLDADLEFKALQIAKQGIKIAHDEVKMGEKAVENEEMVAKQLGISGNLAKMFADKLGVGEDVYSAMTLKARELVDENGKITTAGKWKVLAAGIGAAFKTVKENLKDPAVIAAGIVATYKGMSSAMTSAGNASKKAMSAIGAEEGPITKIAGNISGMMKNIPLVGGLLAGVVDSFAMLLDFAVGAKSEIQKMGREIGLSAQESMTMSNNMYNYATASGKAYLNSKNLFRTHLDINKALDDTNAISGKNVETAYQLTKFAGVEMETVAGLEKLSRVTGKNQANIAGAVANQVNHFKKLTGFGFSFQSVLKEVASMSGYLGLQLAKYPGKMINAVVAAKGLGLELKQLDSMADSFLNFEDSITKQFEAQILTGKEVNLNKARELFLNNELLEAGMEISKQIGSSADFLKMNRIEAASYAEQFGMTRDQMGDFLKQQEQLSAFGVKDTKELQKKVALMKEQGNAQDAINKLGSEEAFNKLVASSATEDLSGFIEKIKESFAQLVANTGLADMVQNFIKFLSEPDNITSILNKIKNVFATIVTVIGSIMGGIMKAINGVAGFFGSDFHIDEGMIDMVTGAGAQIKSFDMGNLVSKKAGGDFGATGVDTSKIYKNETDAQAALRQANISAGGIEKYQITMVLEGQKVAYKIGQINKQNPATSNDGNNIIGVN